MTTIEKVQQEINWLKEDSDKGKIEGFLCVRLHRNDNGRIVPTVTVVAPETASQERVDTVFHCLQGIAEALRAIYDPPVEITSSSDSQHTS